MENFEEINKKITELQELLKKEQEHNDKALVDLFNPMAKKMVWYINERTTSFLRPYVSEALMGQLAIELNKINGEDLLINSSSVLEPPYMTRVKESIREGGILAAVRLYKDYAGVDLKTAKDFVDELKLKLTTNK